MHVLISGDGEKCVFYTICLLGANKKFTFGNLIYHCDVFCMKLISKKLQNKFFPSIPVGGSWHSYIRSVQQPNALHILKVFEKMI